MTKGLTPFGKRSYRPFVDKDIRADIWGGGMKARMNHQGLKLHPFSHLDYSSALWVRIGANVDIDPVIEAQNTSIKINPSTRAHF